MAEQRFDEIVFRRRVDSCLSKIRLILDSQKTSSLGTADEVAHSYDDKYLLATYLTNTSAVCSMNCLKALGLDEVKLNCVLGWVSGKDVSLEFNALESCEFLYEKSREEDSKSKSVVEIGTTKIASKVVTTITEYFYRFKVKYEISAVRGVGASAEDRVSLQAREAVQELCLRAKKMPYSEKNSQCRKVNISWLLRSLSEGMEFFNFNIDRTHKDCHTPSRNKDVAGAVKFFYQLEDWAVFVSNYFTGTLIPIQQTHEPNFKIDLNQMTNTADVFVPVLPLLSRSNESANVPTIASQSYDAVSGQWSVIPSETSSLSDAGGDNAVTAVTTTADQQPQQLIVSAGLANQLLGEETRSLAEKCSQMRQLLPLPTGSSALTTAAEGAVLVVCNHLKSVIAHYEQGIQFIEHMLRQQLIAAVGKELQPSDFAEYMRFHNRKIFREQYQPAPFTHSVRRSVMHSPEGTVRIEVNNTGDAINTVCHSTDAESSHVMEFPLNAAVKAKFRGERHLHAWLAHSFSGQSVGDLKLVAQARQFSSFIVLIGRIAGPSLFEPKHGFIVQNKDEVSIPLLLEQIPTPKEFKKAVSSISPEQQKFAQAIRSMQLESTLFGVCVIQIKPQLEKVLKLAPDSLTKEIALTQDLMKLFIEYQIPTDLMSFEGREDAGASERLEKVRGHVGAMNEMLKKAKEAEIEEENRKRMYAYGAASAAAAAAPCYRSSSFSYAKSACKYEEEEDCDDGGMDLFGCADECAAPVMECCEESAMDAEFTRESAVPSDTPPNEEAPDRNIPESKKDEQQERQEQQQRQDRKQDSYKEEGEERAVVVDYTQIPTQLDKNYEKHDPDSALRPTIIKVGDTWTKKAQAALLSAATTKTLYSSEQASERTAAFDLLDALSRSGALCVEDASLHVVIAATHCFDKSLMNTVVQENVNPIERVERSSLIMASTIHGVSVGELVVGSQLGRLQLTTPSLFIENA